MGRFRNLRTTIAYFAFDLPITRIVFERSPVDGVAVYGNTLTDGGVAVSKIEQYSIRAAIDVDVPKTLVVGRDGSTINQRLSVASSENIGLIDTINDQTIDFYCAYERAYYRLMEYASRQLGDYFTYIFELVRIRPSYLTPL